MRDKLSVRQWQEQFKAGAFDSPDFATQCKAGWYDWFCNDEALAGRLKKLARVVMGVTDPFILDNYYVWFKNNCPMNGPLYDDVRFEPLSGERDGKYFVVTLDSPHEKSKWALYTERNGFDKPEFECDQRDFKAIAQLFDGNCSWVLAFTVEDTFDSSLRHSGNITQAIGCYATLFAQFQDTGRNCFTGIHSQILQVIYHYDKAFEVCALVTIH